MKVIEQEIAALKNTINEMWALVHQQIYNAGEAMLTGDKELAYKVLSRERRVNAFELKIDSDCEDIIALYAPVAIDLRFVLAMYKINTNLERLGDFAESIARFSVNLPESIEYAMIGYRLNDKFTITLGKQDAAWGGFEYDLDPYAIYEYSDMNEYMDCYFTGITLGYQPTPSQELRLQVTDNRIGSMEDTYGILPAGIEKPRAPLFYTFNWNSSYLDEILNLRYSATAGEQAKGKWMYMAWAGHNVCTGPFDGYFDVMYTRGSLDPLGILTELVPPSAENEEGPVCLRNIQYLSLVAEMNYRFHPKWHAFAKGMSETGSVYKAGDEEEELPDGKYRTAWGLQTGIEFYPMADENLHIFLTGTARFYNLTEKAKALCASIENTQRLSVGFIYKLPLY